MLRGPEYLVSDQKRHFDVAIGSLLVAATLLPFGLPTAITATIDNRGNPLYVQQRQGGNHPVFDALKFRTLTRRLDQYPPDQTFGTFDPRASRLGQSLRQTGLDELPQLLNVVRGDMTLVGIRPLLDSDLQDYQTVDEELFDEWLPYYQSSKPGLTGKSQVYRHHYRHTTDTQLKRSMEMDIEYSQEASFWTDTKLLAMTPLGLTRSNIHVVENVVAGAAQPELY